MSETSMGAVPESSPAVPGAVKMLIDQLELPADDAEKDFLVADFLAIRSSSAILYSDAMEEFLR
jgi:hypothetical protein